MGEAERMELVAAAWEENRPELLRFARGMVIRPEIAEDIVQTAGQRAITASDIPAQRPDVRRWLFRIVSNLAIDELRRQGRWSESIVLDARTLGENDRAFVTASEAMRATPEVAAIASQHLAFCFSCTLRSLAPHRAAALLLVEVFGFTVKETAAILNASPGQAKNWLQEARASLEARYAETCALINKKGVCYQCSELSMFFNGRSDNPLAAAGGDIDDRFRILRETKRLGLSDWHRLLIRIIEQRGGSAAVALTEHPTDHR
jgi:RNA polymerase sigma-70 factor (ECF subfamily)